MDELGAQSMIQILLIVILLLCGYLVLLKYVFDHAANRGAFTLLALVLLMIYGGLSGGLMLLLTRMGDMDFVFMALLMLGACITLFLMFVYLLRNFTEMRKGPLSLFVLYLLVLAYITIFSRHGQNSTAIFTSFTAIQEAIETRSFEPLKHMLLNVLLFVPLGVLFPMMQPEKLNSLLRIIPVGAMLSVTIESIQLLLGLGQCDLEDIVANTLGAVIGLLGFRLYRRYVRATYGDDDEGEMT